MGALDRNFHIGPKSAMLDPQPIRPEGKIIGKEAQATQQAEQTAIKKGYRVLEWESFCWEVGQKSVCFEDLHPS
jgi:hypothetical protein